jgi:hypothetical protein
MSLEKTLRQIQKAKFWRDKKIRGFLFFSLLIIIFSWVYIWLEMRKSGQTVPLHYNILIGIDSIGHWTRLLRLPLYGLIILILNFPFIYKNYEREDKFLLNFLLISTGIIQIILLIAIILIINL